MRIAMPITLVGLLWLLAGVAVVSGTAVWYLVSQDKYVTYRVHLPTSASMTGKCDVYLSGVQIGTVVGWQPAEYGQSIAVVRVLEGTIDLRNARFVLLPNSGSQQVLIVVTDFASKTTLTDEGVVFEGELAAEQDAALLRQFHVPKSQLPVQK